MHREARNRTIYTISCRKVTGSELLYLDCRFGNTTDNVWSSPCSKRNILATVFLNFQYYLISLNTIDGICVTTATSLKSKIVSLCICDS